MLLAFDRRLLGALALVVACSATNANFDDDDSPTSTSTNGSGGGLTVGVGGSTSSGPPGDCSEENKDIYVVSASYELQRFAPQSLMFTPIGVLQCPAGGATPFSMAVDRQGLAYVLYSDGRIFHVSTQDASCMATSFQPNQAFGYELFGMGFVSDAVNSSEETLFVGAYGGVGIGRIDTQSMVLTTLGTYDTVTGAAEITGTGDGRLYGFFESGNDVVAQIDKTNSHILQTYHPTVEIGDAWAFAFWGGSFYLFTNPNLAGSSQVDRFDPMTNTTTTVVPSVGYRIVGAGVSTCAPLVPPE
ncbi:MAG TPA: hypothetical protein VFB62_08100 [Polyangiaceae bacterium]|nr:hypothetical protein [Polyangiaceae bacterium]